MGTDARIGIGVGTGVLVASVTPALPFLLLLALPLLLSSLSLLSWLSLFLLDAAIFISEAMSDR
jgi:hypothetical protein